MQTNRAILIVDDDVEDHMIISDGIYHLDASQELHFKKNGLEALQFLEARYLEGFQIALLVVDLNMPKMGGTDLLEKMKSDDRFSHIPVIIYSTSINAIEKEHCMRLGAHAYITKPLSFDESINIARAFLDIAAGQARP